MGGMDHHHATVLIAVGVTIVASMAGAFTAIFVPLLARQARKRRNG